MSVSYKESAKRHFVDATRLETARGTSFGNASQLFGFSAECSLKALLIGLGLTTDADGSVRDRRRFGHLPFLWREFTTFAQGRNGAKYVSFLNPGTPNRYQDSFQNWSVDHRYRNNSWHDQNVHNAVVAEQRIGAKRCIQALQKAILDGVVK
jgi:hypothetical protein